MTSPRRRPGFTVDPLSYSYRETNASIWRNRIGVTSLLFSITMGLSYLLGRPRK
jgi:hypothetical protein